MPVAPRAGLSRRRRRARSDSLNWRPQSAHRPPPSCPRLLVPLELLRCPARASFRLSRGALGVGRGRRIIGGAGRTIRSSPPEAARFRISRRRESLRRRGRAIKFGHPAAGAPPSFRLRRLHGISRLVSERAVAGTLAGKPRRRRIRSKNGRNGPWIAGRRDGRAAGRRLFAISNDRPAPARFCQYLSSGRRTSSWRVIEVTPRGAVWAAEVAAPAVFRDGATTRAGGATTRAGGDDFGVAIVEWFPGNWPMTPSFLFPYREARAGKFRNPGCESRRGSTRGGGGVGP